MRFCIFMVLSLLSTYSLAGSIANGTWQPTACGQLTAPPQIDNQDAKAFNKSMDVINQWQQQVQQYFECMVKEANADNAVIAESANRLQASHQKTIEALNQSIEAAEKKLTTK